MCEEMVSLADPRADLVFEVDVTSNGLLRLEMLDQVRIGPEAEVSRAERPEPQALTSDTDEVAVNDIQRRRYRSASLWLSHLKALSFAEFQKGAALDACWPLYATRLLSDAGVSLCSFISSLQSLSLDMRDNTRNNYAQYCASLQLTRPLWEELMEDSDDEELQDEVERRVDKLLRYTHTTRHERRLYFKRSPYSYERTKFGGTFKGTYSGAVQQAPRREPLADEVS